MATSRLVRCLEEHAQRDPPDIPMVHPLSMLAYDHAFKQHGSILPPRH